MRRNAHLFLGGSVEEHPPRKLAVILHADVVGSTALVRLNETLAHERIQDAFRRLSDLIEGYGGIAHEIRGDALVAEFARASDAVCAALSFQQSNSEHNAQLGDGIVPTVRVGIALGEEVFADDTVTGSGVVLAQRVEQLSEPGGVCVTAAIHEAIPQRLPFEQLSLGERELSGFEEPVRVYRVALKPGATAPEADVGKRAQSAPGRRRIVAAIAATALIVAGVVVFWLEPWAPREEPASVERMAFPLPDKPSIAVLPFTNMSDDPEQEYFADGMAEDLITDLSKISGLFVIARNSSFSYKGQSVKVRKVAEELGVRYVLEGSVRRVGDQVRINTQLIDATTGGHIWADRFDRSLTDIFKLQDEVVANIVSALAVELTDKEKAARKAREQNLNLKAHENYLRGRQHLERFTAEDTAKAKEFFETAIELDPNHAQALTALGRLHYNQWNLWGEERDKNLARALELGQKSVAVDETLAGPHLLMSQVYRFLFKKEQSEIELKKALALDPKDADTLAGLADVLRFSGGAEQAVGLLQKAMRLDPFYPAWYEFHLGHVLFNSGRYEEAITALKRGAERNSNYPAFPLFMAASYAMLGREKEAHEAAAEVLKINPRFSIKAYTAYVPFTTKEYLDREVSAFRKAGIPE